MLDVPDDPVAEYIMFWGICEGRGSKGCRWIIGANARRQMAFHEMRLHTTERRRPNRLHAAASCASSANGEE